MSRLVLAVALAVLTTACLPDSAESTTTIEPVVEPSTTHAPTTTLETTTTTIVSQAVDICQPRTVIWEPGETYTATCFVLPWSVVAPGDGWRAPLIDSDAMLVSWIDPEDPGMRVNAAFVTGIEPVPTESAEGLDLVDAGSEVIADRDATWVDLYAERYPPTEFLPTGCAGDGSGGVLMRGDIALGYRIAPAPGGASPPDFFAVGACDVARVWTLDVDGRAVTIIGGTGDPNRHDEAMAKLEELFEAMSFDSDSG
ncbi:MAG: hypothetical protein R3324_18630 [Halobacteriales archaeon]|nr:hypothetical protein [Halobacteriales archaeon]